MARNRIPSRTLERPAIREDPLKAPLTRGIARLEIVRMSTGKSHQVRSRLGRSLRPLGKTLVRFLNTGVRLAGALGELITAVGRTSNSRRRTGAPITASARSGL